MKHKYLLLLILAFSFANSYSQNCISLGCASNYGAQTIDATVPDAAGDAGTCYFGSNYKQAFWQFFYSPLGGAFTQTFTPTSLGDPLDLDYIIFDMGLAGPASITCPVNTSGFTEVLCGIDFTPNGPTGPGVDGTLNTVAGHFYAVAIYAWQNGDPTYTFDIGTPQIGGLNLTALNCPGVLPVKLSSFEAKVNNCIVDLEWVAESEANFKNYVVEYSINGSDFQTLGVVPGLAAGKKYSFQHNNPQQGKIFYRLKMVDIDNKIAYSKIIALKLNCSGSSVFVYPNPVTDVLNVNITNAAFDVTSASLFDNSGRLVYSGSMKSGTNTINMTKLAKGVYILRLKNDNETQNIKIVK